MRRKSIVFSAVLIVLMLNANSVTAQDLKHQLVGKTFVRHFSAAGFRHTATYRFYSNKVVYSVKGFFIRDTYQIIGKYQGDKFIGHEPKTKRQYVLDIKILDNRRIKIYKHGYDQRYSEIVKLFPVIGWHVYFLTRK